MADDDGDCAIIIPCDFITPNGVAAWLDSKLLIMWEIGKVWSIHAIDRTVGTSKPHRREDLDNGKLPFVIAGERSGQIRRTPVLCFCMGPYNYRSTNLRDLDSCTVDG
jgi:hypothetical protein